MSGRIGSRRGQSAIMYTFAATTMFGAVGLVVDIGWAYYRKQVLQTAVDAAAMAAALAAYDAASESAPTCSTNGVTCTSELVCPASIATPINNLQKGCMYAVSNGVVPGPKITVTMQSGSGSAPGAPGAAMNYWVTAVATERITQLFSAVLGKPTMNVAARASTGVRQAISGGCFFILNPTADSALSLNGTTNMTTNCGGFVNSNSPQAVVAVGGGTLRVNGGQRLRIVGNWDGSGNLIPTPTTGASPAADPLVDMEPPEVGPCTNSGVNLGSHQHRTIDPGVICNGIYLSAQSRLTLNPGLYVVKGGIDLGGQTTMTGDGVTIYVNDGTVNMAGGAAVNLRAPSSGTWQGVLMFQSRNNSNAATLVGGTTMQMNGVLYFPRANLTYTGGSGADAVATTLVADTLRLVGNTYINAAATSQYMGMEGGVFPVE
jgi:Flp pilus assembly protein TadG